MQAPCSPFPSLFGPKIAIYQPLDPDMEGVWESTHKISAKSTWGNGPFCKKCVFALKVAQNGRNSAKSNFKGPKVPPSSRFQHKTCSTPCGTPVQTREGQNYAKNAPRAD